MKEGSAFLGLPHEQPFNLDDRDHSTICRFSNYNDSQYSRVEQRIVRMATDAEASIFQCDQCKIDQSIGKSNSNITSVKVRSVEWHDTVLQQSGSTTTNVPQHISQRPGVPLDKQVLPNSDGEYVGINLLKKSDLSVGTAPLINALYGAWARLPQSTSRRLGLSGPGGAG